MPKHSSDRFDDLKSLSSVRLCLLRVDGPLAAGASSRKDKSPGSVVN